MLKISKVDQWVQPARGVVASQYQSTIEYDGRKTAVYSATSVNGSDGDMAVTLHIANVMVTLGADEAVTVGKALTEAGYHFQMERVRRAAA